MIEIGYAPIRNPARKDGFWVVAGERKVLYARTSLDYGEQLRLAQVVERDGEPEIERQQSNVVPLRPSGD
jgi:hypothetical protein